MLSVNSLDFLSYKNALKGNYRKGVYAFRTMLENPATAEAFASNPGGVALVLGWPIGYEDHNSAELLELLLGSSVIDQATLTWMAQWYADYADSWDTLASGLDRATFMAANPLIWRALGRSPMASGKVIATLAGLTCSQYADIAAVAADESAMEAVAASQVAMAAVIASSTALNAVVTSQVAMTAVAASQVAMAAVIASPTALAAVVASSTAMTAVAASQVAMTAVANSSTAMTAISASTTALNALCNSSLAVTTNATAWGSPSAGGTLVSGKRILVGFSQKQYESGSSTSTLGAKTGGSGSGDFTITFGAANYNKYQPMAVVVLPLLWRSNSWGGDFSSTYINGVKTIPVT